MRHFFIPVGTWHALFKVRIRFSQDSARVLVYGHSSSSKLQNDILCSMIQSQNLISGAQCKYKRRWAHTGTREVCSKHQDELLCCADNGALAQVSHRGCGVSSLEIFQSCLEMFLGTLPSASLLEMWLHQMDLEVLFHFHHSVILKEGASDTLFSIHKANSRFLCKYWWQ